MVSKNVNAYLKHNDHPKVLFYMNLHDRSRSQTKQLWLRQNVAATPAPAPKH
jgi:hypothetical protein